VFLCLCACLAVLAPAAQADEKNEIKRILRRNDNLSYKTKHIRVHAGSVDYETQTISNLCVVYFGDNGEFKGVLTAATAKLAWGDDSALMAATEVHFFADGTSAYMRDKLIPLADE
jgi:hypothetical protein